jgi:hypothetical protein
VELPEDKFFPEPVIAQETPILVNLGLGILRLRVKDGLVSHLQIAAVEDECPLLPPPLRLMSANYYGLINRGAQYQFTLLSGLAHDSSELLDKKNQAPISMKKVESGDPTPAGFDFSAAFC